MVLARNSASTHQTENPQGYIEVGEKKELLIAIVLAGFILSNLQFFSIPQFPVFFFQSLLEAIVYYF